MKEQTLSANRFAAAVAYRLNEIVPVGFSVRANGCSVDVYTASDDRHASAAASIVMERDGRSLAELVQLAAWAILNGAQDSVIEMLREQWPLGPNGRVAEPAARVEGELLLMWFGKEDQPVIRLSPVSVGEITEGAA